MKHKQLYRCTRCKEERPAADFLMTHKRVPLPDTCCRYCMKHLCQLDSRYRENRKGLARVMKRHGLLK